MFAATKLKLFKLSFNNCAPKSISLFMHVRLCVWACVRVCACVGWDLWALSKSFALFAQINFIYC